MRSGLGFVGPEWSCTSKVRLGPSKEHVGIGFGDTGLGNVHGHVERVTSTIGAGYTGVLQGLHQQLLQCAGALSDV